MRKEGTISGLFSIDNSTLMLMPVPATIASLTGVGPVPSAAVADTENVGL